VQEGQDIPYKAVLLFTSIECKGQATHTRLHSPTPGPRQMLPLLLHSDGRQQLTWGQGAATSRRPREGSQW